MKLKSCYLEIEESVRPLFYVTLLVLAVFATLETATGQTSDVWLGGGGNWGNASMWSSGVPYGNFDVFIDGGNPVTSGVNLNMNPRVMNLNIDFWDYLNMNGHSLTVNGGSIQNNGLLVNSGTLYIGAPTTLSGSGLLNMQDGVIVGSKGQQTLTNQSRIDGSGTIGNASLNVINQGEIKSQRTLTIAADNFINNNIVTVDIGSVLISNNAVTNKGSINCGQFGELQLKGSFNNQGELNVGCGSGTVNISGTFSNFSGTTLTGGKYAVGSTLRFNNANIVTNAAHIALYSGGQILDQNGNDALANFAHNAANSSFVLCGGGPCSLYVPTNFTNAGSFRVMTPGGFGAITYTQTAGTTTVTGSLSANSVIIQGGKVFGKGWIFGAVTSSGSVTAGGSKTTPGKLSLGTTFTQTGTGSLNVQIGGLNVGKQYSQLAVTNGVSLDGTLNITLINGFVPVIGQSFTIVTGSAITGQFRTVNGISINSGEHFQIAYNSSDVTITAVSGAQ